MNKKILKFQIKPMNGGTLPVSIHKNATILTVENQHEAIYLWALVDETEEMEERLFEVFATGVPIDYGMGIERKYINSIQMLGGTLVFHVFERTN